MIHSMIHSMILSMIHFMIHSKALAQTQAALAIHEGALTHTHELRDAIDYAHNNNNSNNNSGSGSSNSGSGSSGALVTSTGTTAPTTTANLLQQSLAHARSQEQVRGSWAYSEPLLKAINCMRECENFSSV